MLECGWCTSKFIGNYKYICFCNGDHSNCYMVLYNFLVLGRQLTIKQRVSSLTISNILKRNTNHPIITSIAISTSFWNLHDSSIIMNAGSSNLEFRYADLGCTQARLKLSVSLQNICPW